MSSPDGMSDLRQRAEALGLVDPIATTKRARAMAPRLASLEGLTAGILDNRKGNAEELLNKVGELLTSEYGVAELYKTKKFVYSRRAEDSVLADLEQNSDFVVTAIGD